MKVNIIPILLVFCMSCKSQKNESSTLNVEYKGALKNMMFKGDISAKVDLKEFEHIEHFYGLGAVENLKGEIQIFDSRPINTSVIGNKLKPDYSFNKKATLLVYSSVDKWKKLTIPVNITSNKELEEFIELTAKQNQINIDKPFPFLVTGVVKSLNWHVMDWKDGDKDHSHEKHKTSGLSGVINNQQVEILGFYSNAHHAIFTHHSTNIHLHMKTLDGKVAGHVDELTLGGGMMLMLPG